MFVKLLIWQNVQFLMHADDENEGQSLPKSSVILWSRAQLLPPLSYAANAFHNQTICETLMYISVYQMFRNEGDGSRAKIWVFSE